MKVWHPIQLQYDNCFIFFLRCYLCYRYDSQSVVTNNIDFFVFWKVALKNNFLANALLIFQTLNLVPRLNDLAPQQFIAPLSQYQFYSLPL